jgi:hypothetical protein
MKIHNISILGACIGLIILVSSVIRWVFIWGDISQAILGGSIGLLVIILSYIYNWMRNIDIRMDNLKERMDSTASFFMGEEKETIKSKMRGLDEE